MEIRMSSRELDVIREDAHGTGQQLADALIRNCEDAVGQMPFMSPEQHQAILITLGLGILAKAEELREEAGAPIRIDGPEEESGGEPEDA